MNRPPASIIVSLFIFSSGLFSLLILLIVGSAGVGDLDKTRAATASVAVLGTLICAFVYANGLRQLINSSVSGRSSASFVYSLGLGAWLVESGWSIASTWPLVGLFTIGTVCLWLPSSSKWFRSGSE